MLNKSEFDRIRREMHRTDLKREGVIQLSREIITISKQVIYAAQRNDLKTAASAIKNIKNNMKKIGGIEIYKIQ